MATHKKRKNKIFKFQLKSLHQLRFSSFVNHNSQPTEAVLRRLQNSTAEIGRMASAPVNKIERAHLMYREGRYEEALGFYTEALSMAKTKPQKIALHSNRAACFLKLHDFKKVLPFFSFSFAFSKFGCQAVG